MRLSKLRIGLSALFASVSLAAPAAAATPDTANQYAAQVKFRWSGAPPASVAEENTLTGIASVTTVANPFTWRTTQKMPPSQSNIQLRYDGGTYIFPFRSFRGAPVPEIEFARPTYSCAHTDIDRIEATRNSTVQTRLAAMMATGALLQLSTAACPKSSKDRLADLYYGLNCSLAAEATFVGYLDAAETAFRERWQNNPAKLRDIDTCRRRSRDHFVSVVTHGLAGQISGSQFTAAYPLAVDISRLKEQAEWKESFGAYALSETDIQALGIRALHEQQLLAVNSGDLQTADQLNASLRKAYGTGENAQAFRNARLDLDRLELDARVIRAQAAIARYRTASQTPYRQ